MGNRSAVPVSQAKSLLELTARPLAEQGEVSLSAIAGGKYSMVINVASKWGLTDKSYKAMKAMSDRFKGRNFTILAFPCNQFLSQEPWEESKIKEWTAEKYGVDFPMFGKINVKGENAHPVYQYLLREKPGKIPWNFGAKFICDPDGKVIARYDKSQNWKEIEEMLDPLLTASC